MENRMKHDIEIEKLEREYKDFKDGVYSTTLLIGIAILVFQFSGILF